MIKFYLTGYILFILLIKVHSQDSNPKVDKDEIWRERYNFGLNASYPHIAFLNMGMKFYDKIYIEFFFEINDTKRTSNYFDLGYQSNNLFSNNIKSQIGISLIQVPNKDYSDKINNFGLNLKFTKPIATWAGIFISGHIGLPSSNIYYENLATGNFGIEFYLKYLPLIIY